MIKDGKDWESVPNEVIKKVKSKSFSDYMDGSIILIVVALFVTIIISFLVEFVFDPNLDWKEIGTNTVLISVCTIAIYLLMRLYSMRKGRNTEAWRPAYEGLTQHGKEILKDNRARLITTYCRQWEEEQLNDDIEAMVVPVGLTLNEYKDKYAKYDKKELAEKCKELTEYQRKTVLKAKRIKRLKFNERYFYINAGNADSGRHRSPSSGVKTKQLNQIAILRTILTTLVFSLVSASLLREIIFDFSWASVVKCLIKVAITLFFGAMGMISGYNFTSVKEVAEMNAKSDEIDVFLKWCEGRETKSVAAKEKALEEG